MSEEDDFSIRRTPPGEPGAIPVTSEEAAAWLVSFGRIMTFERDGQLYRVLEIDEKPPAQTQTDGEKT